MMVMRKLVLWKRRFLLQVCFPAEIQFRCIHKRGNIQQLPLKLEMAFLGGFLKTGKVQSKILPLQRDKFGKMRVKIMTRRVLRDLTCRQCSGLTIRILIVVIMSPASKVAKLSSSPLMSPLPALSSTGKLLCRLLFLISNSGAGSKYPSVYC